MLMTAVITFTASELAPYLEFKLYRRSTIIAVNTTVLAGDTVVSGIGKWVQRYYTTATGDVMTAILTGPYNSNPLYNSTAYSIGVAVKNLTTVPSTLTLSAVNCIINVYRIG
jgi:hypothetical protein